MWMFLQNSVRLRKKYWIGLRDITVLCAHIHVHENMYMLKHTQQVRFLILRETKRWSRKLANQEGESRRQDDWIENVHGQHIHDFFFEHKTISFHCKISLVI